METVALGITAPVASFTVPEMRPPTPARAAKARIKRAAKSEMIRPRERGRGRNTSLLVASHYQLGRECRLVVNGCQLEFCKNLVTIRCLFCGNSRVAGFTTGCEKRVATNAPGITAV